MQLTRHGAARRGRGFTLIEVLVTLTILGILMAAAAPAFSAWVRNARIRTVAQALQDGLRFAQAESIRRNRQIVFALINGPTSWSATAVTSGSNWMIFTVPLLGSESREFVQGGSVSDTAGGVVVSGSSSAICFNSAGRLVARAAPGLSGATCTIDPSAPTNSYNVSLASGDRPLRVTVSLAGQVRVCDPARTQSASAADGCP